jgi:hypothetical protein
VRLRCLLLLALPALLSAAGQDCFKLDSKQLQALSAGATWPLGLEEQPSKNPVQDFEAYVAERKRRQSYWEGGDGNEYLGRKLLATDQEDAKILEGLKQGKLQVVQWTRSSVRICGHCGEARILHSEGKYLKPGAGQLGFALSFETSVIVVQADGSNRSREASYDLGFCHARSFKGRRWEGDDYGDLAVSDSGQYSAFGRIRTVKRNQFQTIEVTVTQLGRDTILYRRGLDAQPILEADHLELINFGSVLKVEKDGVARLFSLTDPYLPPEGLERRGHAF